MILTGTQFQVYHYITKYINEHGYSPSWREIMKGTGLTSTSSVSHQLSSLQSKGLITYQDRIARSITLENK